MRAAEVAAGRGVRAAARSCAEPPRFAALLPQGLELELRAPRAPMAVLDGAPLYAPPAVSWNTLLLVLNCGGGDAARRLAGDRDSLSAIRRFIKFAPDWRALEVVLGTPRAPGMVFSWAPTRTFYQEPAFSAITPAMMVEYARFLGLFKGVPHGLLSPPPSWPRLLDEYGDPSRGSNFLQRIWRFHSKQDSYAQDCLALTGREIPYYEYEDSPTWLHRLSLIHI